MNSSGAATKPCRNALQEERYLHKGSRRVRGTDGGHKEEEKREEDGAECVVLHVKVVRVDAQPKHVILATCIEARVSHNGLAGSEPINRRHRVRSVESSSLNKTATPRCRTNSGKNTNRVMSKKSPMPVAQPPHTAVYTDTYCRTDVATFGRYTCQVTIKTA